LGDAVPDSPPIVRACLLRPAAPLATCTRHSSSTERRAKDRAGVAQRGDGRSTKLDARTAFALTARQELLQAEAHAVPAHLDLPGSLGRLGPFEHVGSSASGLMVHRDLDVCVRGSSPTTAQVLEALHPVITHSGVHEIVHRDDTGPRSPTGRPEDQRHYVVLRYDHHGHPWKIDITVWISRTPRPQLDEVDRLKREATGAKRHAILWIKDTLAYAR
jgi:hypothetical protein